VTAADKKQARELYDQKDDAIRELPVIAQNRQLVKLYMLITHPRYNPHNCNKDGITDLQSIEDDLRYT
jgi:acyl-CoA-binding protein